MKLICTTITLLLFTFSVHAQMKIEITSSDSKYASMGIDCQDKAKCDKKLLKWIRKQKFFKGEWKQEPRQLLNDKDVQISKVSKSIEGANITRYFHPSNFTVQLRNMAADIADKEAKRAERKAKRKKLKSLSLAKKSNESVSKWRARVAEALDEMLKDMGEE